MMVRHLTTFSAFGFAFMAGTTWFVTPRPIAAIATALLLLLFFALLDDRDELTSLAADRAERNRAREAVR